MNENDSRLMIAVERIVRPVFAHMNTKLRMREELYTLLSDIYNEEVSRTDSPEEALQKSVLRLGNSGKLTQELQASVPWHSFPAIRKLPFIANCNEDIYRMSDWRFSLMFALFQFCLCCLLFGAVALLAPSQAIEAVGNLLLLLLAFQFLGPLCFMLLVRRTMACFRLQSGLARAAGCGVIAIVASTLAYLGLASLFYVSNEDLAASLSTASHHLLAAVSCGALVLLVGWATQVEYAKLRPWIELDIDKEAVVTSC